MVDQNCAYCVEGDLVAKFGIKICELETSKVYLFKEQSHPGRCIVAHKKHVGDMNELTAEERAAYFEDVARVARAIMAAFHPDKVNYGAYGDTGHHLHFHLCPKYKDEFEWGGVFLMNPDKKYLTDAEYAEMIEKIKSNMLLIRAMQNFINQIRNACISISDFEILSGGYATPPKCEAFWRLALNSYNNNLK